MRESLSELLENVHPNKGAKVFNLEVAISLINHFESPNAKHKHFVTRYFNLLMLIIIN